MKIRITIPSDPTCLSMVRSLVKQSMPADRFEEVTIEQVIQAVDEACSNVIEHSYGMVKGREFSMTMNSDSEKVTFLIEDSGTGLKSVEESKPDIEEYVKQRRDGGWGRYLIAHVMDEVKYTKKGKTNRLKLVKYFNGKGKRREYD